uniref:Uncharacterized protein n=1 Tax=Aegilops tauschii subsp. strangulata TaxID=200361 RepID=A0A453RSU1_AEGTS
MARGRPLDALRLKFWARRHGKARQEHDSCFTYPSSSFSVDWKGLRLDKFCILHSRFVLCSFLALFWSREGTREPSS